MEEQWRVFIKALLKLLCLTFFVMLTNELMLKPIKKRKSSLSHHLVCHMTFFQCIRTQWWVLCLSEVGVKMNSSAVKMVTHEIIQLWWPKKAAETCSHTCLIFVNLLKTLCRIMTKAEWTQRAQEDFSTFFLSVPLCSLIYSRLSLSISSSSFKSALSSSPLILILTCFDSFLSPTFPPSHTCTLSLLSKPISQFVSVGCRWDRLSRISSWQHLRRTVSCLLSSSFFCCHTWLLLYLHLHCSIYSTLTILKWLSFKRGKLSPLYVE